MVVRRNGARCTCGRKGCMEAYAGRKAMEIEAGHRHKNGAKTSLFKIMKKKGRPVMTSGVWAEALEHDDELAVELIDRAVAALAAGVASAVNLLDIEAVVFGGGLGTRLGDALHRADRAADAAPPVRRHPPAGGARGRPRRPLRRDRRRAARQA